MTSILALDSSSENCSVAVLREQQIHQRVEHAPRKHTQLILPLVKDVLANTEITLDKVEAIAFGCGPGSFTGIRIAAGVAQGLAYGLAKPIYAISNLQGLALQSYLEHGIEHVLVCIDARMDEVYWSVLQIVKQENQGRTSFKLVQLTEEQVSSPNSVNLASVSKSSNTSKLLIAGIGSGMMLIPDAIRQQLSFVDSEAEPTAESIAYLAQEAIDRGEPGNLDDALPSYIRDTVTWNKLPGRE